MVLFDLAFPISAMPSILMLLGGVFAIYAFHHRYRMLSAFHPKKADALESFREYMEPHLSKWATSTSFRFVAIGILAAMMIYLLTFHKDTRWAEISGITFISFILGTILRNWLDFEDKILLYDIERAFRDQEGSD